MTKQHTRPPAQRRAARGLPVNLTARVCWRIRDACRHCVASSRSFARSPALVRVGSAAWEVNHMQWHVTFRGPASSHR
jgi:hypothetical protein